MSLVVYNKLILTYFHLTLTSANSVRLVEVSRTCIQPQRDDGCFDTTWNGISVYACACNTDYCNTANPTISPPWGVLAQFLLAVTVWLIQRIG